MPVAVVVNDLAVDKKEIVADGTQQDVADTAYNKAREEYKRILAECVE